MLPSADQKPRYVERMFDRIAPRYDLMNRVMTLGIDRSWRHAAVRAAAIGPGDLVLDLGCGTGDLCREVQTLGARVVGVDPALRMLEVARRSVPGCILLRAVGERLPIATASCDVVVSGFALRNFSAVNEVLGECARVLVPGGRLVILEVDVPGSWWLRTGFRTYFHGIVPLLGRLVSDGPAYAYLSESLDFLPSEARLNEMLFATGFDSVTKTRLAAGVAQTVVARKEVGRG